MRSKFYFGERQNRFHFGEKGKADSARVRQMAMKGTSTALIDLFEQSEQLLHFQLD